MSDFDVLMLGSMPPAPMSVLASGCRLHRLGDAPDREAEIARLAPVVRGLCAGDTSAKADAALMARFPALEIVSNFGVGYDEEAARWAGAHGIVVTHTPDVLNEEVADTTFGLLLNAVREFPRADSYLRAGRWLEKPYPLTASLRGRTMGILGLGRIGKAIARRAEAFSLKVIYHGRRRQTDVAYPFHADLVEMAHACDILVAIAPGGAGTRHIVNAAVLDALGRNGVFINVGRGSLVDEDALVRALQERRILTAGLDVFADEPRVSRALIDMDHVVLAPHVGSASHATRDAMCRLVVDNIVSFAAGKGPLTPVPETPWPATRKQARHAKPGTEQ